MSDPQALNHEGHPPTTSSNDILQRSEFGCFELSKILHTCEDIARAEILTGAFRVHESPSPVHAFLERRQFDPPRFLLDHLAATTARCPGARRTLDAADALKLRMFETFGDDCLQRFLHRGCLLRPTPRKANQGAGTRHTADETTPSSRRRQTDWETVRRSETLPCRWQLCNRGTWTVRWPPVRGHVPCQTPEASPVLTSNPDTYSAPCTTSTLDPSKSSPMGSKRPPRQPARKPSVTAKNDIRFSGLAKP